MSGARHRYRRSGSSLRRAAGLAVVPLAAGAVAGGWFVLQPGPGAPGCTGSVTLTVAVSPSLTEPLRAAAASNGGRPDDLGYCASVQVKTVESGKAAAYLRGGWIDPQAGAVPDVWIPDSADWLTLTRTTEAANRLVVDAGTLIATSPVVIAMPRPQAEAAGWPQQQLSWSDLREHLDADGYWASRGQPAWGDFTLGIPDPRTSTSGLSALASVAARTLGLAPGRLTEKALTDDLAGEGAVPGLERATDLVTGSEPELLGALRRADGSDSQITGLSAIPLSESLVYQYNRGVGLGTGLPAGPGPELVASYPPDGLILDEVRYVRLSSASADPAKERAADDLLALLRSGPGRALLADSGFRAPDGSADRFGPATGLVARAPVVGKAFTPQPVLTALQGTFVSVHQRGNILIALDSSGSMNDPVPGSGGRSRLAVAVDAARNVLPLFADGSHLGLWRFSAFLDGDQDWEELVPLGPLDEPVGAVPRPRALSDAMSGIEPDGDTGLYDAVLAAFRHLNQHYKDGWPNQVVLLTDGRNSDPGSMSLDELIRTLRREYSAQRPVQVITVGYGEDADLGALARISAATGAESHPAQDPNTIFTVFVGALSSIPR